MCGIIGAVTADKPVATLIRNALKRLEYRGYDSVGIATINQGQLQIKKDQGKINEVDQRVDLTKLPGTMGIGHTRWATHGPPNKVNSHPHTDCKRTIALVHNGICENYLDLKERLAKKGHTFTSETDTEIIVHQIEEHLKNTEDLSEAVRKTLQQVEGYYAIAVISLKDPNTIVCARNGSPLVLGTSKTANYCASDITAFLPLTKRIYYLMDGELAILTPDKIEIQNIATGQPVTRKQERVAWTAEQAQKGGYPHFMLKEIHEQPNVLKQTLESTHEDLPNIIDTINDSTHIYLTAAGTAYHSCIAGSYMLTNLAGKYNQPMIASEVIYNLPELPSPETTLIAVSQSGESADTLQAVRHAKELGAKIIAITNTLGSSVTRMADYVFYTRGGPEIGVAATKTFTLQVTSFAIISPQVALMNGKLNSQEQKQLWQQTLKLPDILNDTITTLEKKTEEFADIIKDKKSCYYLGRGVSSATAKEGALKIKEIAYIHAEAYPAGESKHGPIALLEKDYPVVFVAPPDETRKLILGNIAEMKARGGTIITALQQGDEVLTDQSHYALPIPPGTPNPFTTIVYTTPLQLLAYYTAVKRGCPVDAPRNLAKSVTVV